MTAGHSITPRRRRTIVCAHLRIDGQPVSLGQVRWWTSQQPLPTVVSWIKGRLLGCNVRRTELSAPWVDDICTSSWGRDCPFVSDATCSMA